VRRFTDDRGREWEVVAGRESWGAIFAIFIPTDGTGPLRQSHLDAASYEAANREMDALDASAMQALLDRSTEKSLG
jgi:hypothetical protein